MLVPDCLVDELARSSASSSSESILKEIILLSREAISLDQEDQLVKDWILYLLRERLPSQASLSEEMLRKAGVPLLLHELEQHGAKAVY